MVFGRLSFDHLTDDLARDVDRPYGTVSNYNTLIDALCKKGKLKEAKNVLLGENWCETWYYYL